MSDGINGVIVPLITPLTKDGKVDKSGLAQLVEYVIEGGVSAIFLLGSCGEFPALTLEERIELVAQTKKVVRGRVPILVGVGEASTHRVLLQLEGIKRAGADAIVAMLPYYYRYTQNELFLHFSKIAEKSHLEVLIYNNPELMGNTVSPDLVHRLARIPNIIGLKDSGGNVEVFQSFLRIKDTIPDFSIYEGFEPAAAASLLRGADGVVLGVANVAPKMCVDLYNAAKEKRLSELWKIQDQLLRLRTVQKYKSWLAGLKTAVSLLGLGTSTVSAPFEPLTKGQVAAVQATLEEVGLL